MRASQTIPARIQPDQLPEEQCWWSERVVGVQIADELAGAEGRYIYRWGLMTVLRGPIVVVTTAGGSACREMGRRHAETGHRTIAVTAPW